MATSSTLATRRGLRLGQMLRTQGALIALLLLIAFGGLRYQGFLGAYNIAEMLRYNAMFALIALGMTFVIMTGGIDLSVGSVVALASVVAALLTPYGDLPAYLGPLLVGTLVGLLNGLLITRAGIPPFIATLAMLLAARGLALILAGPTAGVSIDFGGGFMQVGSGNLAGVPIPVIITLLCYAAGAVLLNHTRFGRHVLAIGGNEEATRLAGLPVDRIKLLVYALSGGLAGLAGMLLAAQTFTGLPTAGAGWELSAIASVVVGGTLLTGGLGSVGGSLVGALLLGLIFNILNFENGQGLISLSAFWQEVIRGLFLLVVVLLQSRVVRRNA
jgi:galactofuranose transport system permease protein